MTAREADGMTALQLAKEKGRVRKGLVGGDGGAARGGGRGSG